MKQELILPPPSSIAYNIEFLLRLNLFVSEHPEVRVGEHYYYKTDGAGNYDFYGFREGNEFVISYDHESDNNHFGNHKHQKKWFEQNGVPENIINELTTANPPGEAFTWATSIAWFQDDTWYYVGSLTELNRTLKHLKELPSLPEAVLMIQDYYGVWEGEFWDEDFSHHINSIVSFFPNSVDYYDYSEPTAYARAYELENDYHYWNFVATDQPHTQLVVEDYSTGFYSNENMVLIPSKVFKQENKANR